MNIGNIVLYNNEFMKVTHIAIEHQTCYYYLENCFGPILGIRTSRTFPVLFNSLSEFKQANPELFI